MPPSFLVSDFKKRFFITFFLHTRSVTAVAVSSEREKWNEANTQHRNATLSWNWREWDFPSSSSSSLAQQQQQHNTTCQVNPANLSRYCRREIEIFLIIRSAIDVVHRSLFFFSRSTNNSTRRRYLSVPNMLWLILENFEFLKMIFSLSSSRAARRHHTPYRAQANVDCRTEWTLMRCEKIV